MLIPNFRSNLSGVLGMAFFDDCTDMNSLINQAKSHLVYEFDQGHDWWNVRWVGGACDAISFDWIRRKALGKKNFDDKKFQAGWIYNARGRRDIGYTHAAFHNIFNSEKEMALKNRSPLSMEQTWAPKAWANTIEEFNKHPYGKSKGFDQLSVSVPGLATALNNREQRREAINAVFSDAGTSMAAALNFTRDGKGSGHMIAVYYADPSVCYCFDPNVGEFKLATDQAKSFVTALWQLKYVDMTGMYPFYFTRA